MAIGIAQMLGFRLPENFNRPYSAVSITDFWRRWHMTLSRWFRDYVYIPLGGSRGSERATYRNLLIVFVLTGFWHGAAWTFVVWGLYHGAWMLLERGMGWRGLDGGGTSPAPRRDVPDRARRLGPVPRRHAVRGDELLRFDARASDGMTPPSTRRSRTSGSRRSSPRR